MFDLCTNWDLLLKHPVRLVLIKFNWLERTMEKSSSKPTTGLLS